MQKYKIVKKKGISQIVLKSQKGQQLCERELQTINGNKIAGLLPVEITQKNSIYTLQYDITKYALLKDYLKNPLTKGAFLHMLKNILATLKKLQEEFISQNYILLDTNYVTINPSTGQIYFICIPIQFYDTNTSLKEFLLHIIQMCSFSNTENVNYVSEYIKILNQGTNISVFELEEYLIKLSEPQKIDLMELQKKCPKCQSIFKNDSKYCTNCGHLILVRPTMTGERIFDPLATELEKTEILGKTVREIKTIVLTQKPYLMCQETLEKIELKKFPFKIGKIKEESDYIVSHNNAVSRRHAEIFQENSRYYIIDKNSTNGTFINGIEITPNVKTEIYSGNKITLANEDFLFFIK